MSPTLARPATAVRVHDLHKRFAGRAALAHIDLEIGAGERVALLGASGSGKSTLLRCLCGLELAERMAGGRVEIFGRVMQADGELADEARLLRRRIGVIFQQFNLIGRLPVATNVLAGLSASRPVWRSLLGRFHETDRARVLDALSAVGLQDQAFQRASTLSGGQQQRAAIARALVQGADLLLADEPVASLDPESTRRVMELLLALNRQHGMTLLVTLHDVDLAQQYFERVVALRDGMTVYDGPTAGLSAARIAQLYGATEGERPTPVVAPGPHAANDPMHHVSGGVAPSPNRPPDGVPPLMGLDPA